LPGGAGPALIAPLRTTPGGPVNGVALLGLDGQSERFSRLVGETSKRAVMLTGFQNPEDPLVVAIDLVDAWRLGTAAWSRGDRFDIAVTPCLKSFAGGLLGDRYGRINPDMPQADPDDPPWILDDRDEVIIALRRDLQSPSLRVRKSAGGTASVTLRGEAAARFYGGVLRQAWTRGTVGTGANTVRLLLPAQGAIGFGPVIKREAA
jgi:hypothetical protein